ncbi:hypothetical protein HD554DRAFT_671528 [Boletus coccyginus]|nr:hypothetical protein HD554DRAFT_671528 [Boletus coccyginus]
MVKVCHRVNSAPLLVEALQCSRKVHSPSSGMETVKTPRFYFDHCIAFRIEAKKCQKLPLRRVSSQIYSKHWTAGDIARTFSQSDETVGVFRCWSIASGIGEGQVALGCIKGWIQVDASVGTAGGSMTTEYMCTHTCSTKRKWVGGIPPSQARPSVHFDAKLTRRSGGEHASPAHDLGQPRVGTGPEMAGTVLGIIDELKQCDGHIIPLWMGTATIMEYTPQAYLQSDLQMKFAQNLDQGSVGKEPHLVLIDGGIPQSFNGESALDLQYATEMVTGDQTS